MKKQILKEFKPFFSVVIVIATLLSMVFIKMEVRRVGYSLLKKDRVYKTLKDHYQLQALNYMKKTSPSRLRKMARSRLTLTDARMGQIVQLSGSGIAIRQ